MIVVAWVECKAFWLCAGSPVVLGPNTRADQGGDGVGGCGALCGRVSPGNLPAGWAGAGCPTRLGACAAEYLIAPSDDGAVFVWDYATGALTAVLEGDSGEGGVACVATHPHAPMLASGGREPVVTLWSPEVRPARLNAAGSMPGPPFFLQCLFPTSSLVSFKIHSCAPATALSAWAAGGGWLQPAAGLGGG